MDDDFYTVFAEHARKHGLEKAVERLRSLPDVSAYADQWVKDRDRIDEGGPIIVAAARGEGWYSGPTSGDIFWPPLKNLFAEQHWDDERIASVDQASSKVVAHTPQPSTRAFDARGLVVGYVQSGKTTNFTAVAAKMADVDYRFILVLSGIHNGLRRQTQERLEEQLLGLNRDRWFFLTTPEQDFRAPAKITPANLFRNDGQVALAVVKKNATVLRRLRTWLNTPVGRAALQDVPVLIIDDEADQASVATGSINPLILDILRIMPRHTYIGYTATPFANVFINPAEEDLYPSTFILNLPQPDGYFGPETVFGRDEVEGDETGSAPDGYDMIRTIRDEDVSLLRPASRADASGFTPTLTDQVIDAVHWFVLATAARRARGDEKHSTMLVHTSVKTDVHQAFQAPLQSLMHRLREGVAGGDEALLDRLRKLWEKESASVPSTDWGRTQNTFDELLPHLPTVLEACGIIIDNSRSEFRLDYSGEEPVVAIVVGGNTLSRGLTLEGLVVSLFVRGASTYDTLLQMGRWFGYRTGYEDLPRIWTTQELELAFRHLAQVEVEMRRDIDRYQTQNLTPLDLAVRIRTHPSLQITAKMGAAAPAAVSYAGSRLQLRYYKRLDRDWLLENRAAAERLVTASVQHGEHSQVARAGHHVIRNVPVTHIKSFLQAYRMHPEQADLDPGTLIRWIDRQITSSEPTLQSWNVVIVQGSVKQSETMGPLAVHPVVRARVGRALDGDVAEAQRLEEAETGDIKTLMSRRDIGLDLDLPEGDLSKLAEKELVALRESHPEASTRGLLVLYLIDKESRPSPGREKTRVPMDAVEPLVGIGIAFPGTKVGTRGVTPTHMSVDLSDVEVEDKELYTSEPDGEQES